MNAIAAQHQIRVLRAANKQNKFNSFVYVDKMWLLCIFVDAGCGCGVY